MTTTHQTDITAAHLDDLVRTIGIDLADLRRGFTYQDADCVALLAVSTRKTLELVCALAHDLTDMDILASNGLPDPLKLTADLLADVHTALRFGVEYTVLPAVHVEDEDDDEEVLDDGVFDDAAYDRISDMWHLV